MFNILYTPQIFASGDGAQGGGAGFRFSTFTGGPDGDQPVNKVCVEYPTRRGLGVEFSPPRQFGITCHHGLHPGPRIFHLQKLKQVAFAHEIVIFLRLVFTKGKAAEFSRRGLPVMVRTPGGGGISDRAVNLRSPRESYHFA